MIPELDWAIPEQYERSEYYIHCDGALSALMMPLIQCARPPLTQVQIRLVSSVLASLGFVLMRACV